MKKNKIKINWKKVIIGSIICLLPCLLAASMWNDLPDEFPIHWNIHGEIDDTASKWVAVFALPIAMAIFNVVLHILESFSDKKENHSKALTALTYWIIPVITIITSSITILSGAGKKINVPMIMGLFIGLLFVFIGNFLPKCKQNRTMGIKLPWTLKSEENWNKTHRLGGWVLTICGLLLIASTFANLTFMLPVIIFLSAIIPTVYSFVLHKRGI